MATESMGRVYDAATQVDDAHDAGLLLRMGIYLTQRYIDCNSRSAATRLDLPQATSVWAGRLIAEHAFGLSLTVQHALANDRLGDYVVDSGTAERSVDAEAFFADLDPDDIELLDNMYNETKVDFLDEISRSFAYGTSVFGSGLDVRNSVYAAKS